MLPTPKNSTVLLVNPSRSRLTPLPSRFRHRVDVNLILLRHLLQISGVAIRILGDVTEPMINVERMPSCKNLGADTLRFWREKKPNHELGEVGRFVYIAGAWLDQEVFATALSTNRIGYETRVLVDVSVARSRFDRQWALERLEQESVRMTTIRQTVTEWSLAASDEATFRQLRKP
jgi:Isochorismatase family